MKKITLLLLMISLSFYQSLLAQDTNLIGNWYLKSIQTDLEADEFITTSTAPQNPTLIINDDFTFNGIAACNTFSGDFSFISDNTFSHENFSSGTNNCETESYSGFEDFYFSHFDNSEGNEIELYIDGGNLVLETAPGFGLTFQNQPFIAAPTIHQEWPLEVLSLDIDGPTNVSSFDPPIFPTINIASDFSFTATAACNTFSGNFVQSMEFNNGYRVENFTQTNDDCDDFPFTLTEFDQSFRGFFQEVDLFFTTTYSPQGEELLTITNTAFSKASFAKRILSVEQQKFIQLSLLPNPTSNSITINSNNNTIDHVEIYSITGQVLQSIKGSISTIDVSHLSQGTYFLKVYSGDNFAVEQFVKK